MLPNAIQSVALILLLIDIAESSLFRAGKTIIISPVRPVIDQNYNSAIGFKTPDAQYINSKMMAPDDISAESK